MHTNLGVKYIGAARSNRMSGDSLMADKELMKKEREVYDYRLAEGV